MSGLIENVAKAIELTKTLLKAKVAIQNAEVMMALADLSTELAQVKVQAAELLVENQQLKERVKKLSEPPEVTVRNGVYWKESGDGPYCTTCYDVGRRLVRLQELTIDAHIFGKWCCGSCQTHFSGK